VRLRRLHDPELDPVPLGPDGAGGVGAIVGLLEGALYPPYVTGADVEEAPEGIDEGVGTMEEEDAELGEPEPEPEPEPEEPEPPDTNAATGGPGNV